MAIRVQLVAFLLGSVFVLASGAAAFAAAPVSESSGRQRAGGVVTPRPAARPVETPAPPATTVDESVAPGRAVDVPAGDERVTGVDVFAAAGTRAPAPTSGEENSGSLAYQVQVLRQEVLDVRGQLEELQHRLARMEQDQSRRYQDLDRRLGSGDAGSSNTTAPPPTDDGAPSDRVEGVDAGEQAAYADAVRLTREKQYQPAIDAFNRQLTEYPDGAFSANAFYWLGELYLAQPKPRLEMARQSFAQVVNLYPEHQKVSDALYKLGVVYGRLGDRDAAARHMRRVRDEFAGSSAASLAEAYLANPE